MSYLFRVMLFLVLIISINSCQSARELHYFKQEGNYYRLKINEKSFASKSRYLAGYFDEQAVDKYFSEMSQPDSAKVVEWLAKPGGRTKLVMILSTNSNSVSEQIGSFANNEELLEMVARLANKDKIAQSNNTNTEIEGIKVMAGNISTTAAAYFPNATVTNLKINIQDFLENLRVNIRGKLQLENIGVAITKYQQQ